MLCVTRLGWVVPNSSVMGSMSSPRCASGWALVCWCWVKGGDLTRSPSLVSRLTSLHARRRGARMKRKKKRSKMISAVCRPKRRHGAETSLARPLLDRRL